MRGAREHLAVDCLGFLPCVCRYVLCSGRVRELEEYLEARRPALQRASAEAARLQTEVEARMPVECSS